MKKKPTSLSGKIGAMTPGDSISVSLKDYKYTSINSALYRKRLEGMVLESAINRNRTAVTITRTQ